MATRGGKASPEGPFVIEHREAHIYMLCQAAELEHSITCQYLHAAFSLKREGEGLAGEQLAAVQRWRSGIMRMPTQEMLQLHLGRCSPPGASGAGSHHPWNRLPTLTACKQAQAS